MKNIEFIARVLIIKENKILLCKSLKQGHYFLPGGHIEFGEKAEKALIRELGEESNIEISDLKFIGIFENFYKEDGQSHHEMNILYTGEIVSREIMPKEKHIDFDWIDMDNLMNVNFLPQKFAGCIIKWGNEKNIIYLNI